MMVLRRKQGEVIRIGENIRIVVQDIQQGRVVKLAIDAPLDIPVHRLEIYKIIQQENRAASHSNALQWLQNGGQVDATSHDAS
ncbi:MAG: carbon storage regulator [Mariprofundaceae bacterium]